MLEGKIEIGIKEFQENFIKLLSEEWMLVSAGTNEKFNTMTASWGGIGFLWNRPVAFIFIRPERYTYEFIEQENFLTLSFFDRKYREALTICGTRSGRDTDKVSESGLTPLFLGEDQLPSFRESRITLACRKVYGEMMNPDQFLDRGDLDKWYGVKGGMHKLYIAEIVNVWVEEVK